MLPRDDIKTRSVHLVLSLRGDTDTCVLQLKAMCYLPDPYHHDWQLDIFLPFCHVSAVQYPMNRHFFAFIRGNAFGYMDFVSLTIMGNGFSFGQTPGNLSQPKEMT